MNRFQFARKAWRAARRIYLLDEQQGEPVVTLQANDNWIEFTLRYAVAHRHRQQVKDRLCTRILEEIDQPGEKVAIASTTVQLIDPAPYTIRLDNEIK